MSADRKNEPQVVWHDQAVSREMRSKLFGHRGCVVWFTGLSGSGKSTIANAVDQLLNARGVHTYLLDGDNVRHGLCAPPKMLEPIHGKDFAQRFGLGFEHQDREENNRRAGAVAQLFAAAGIVCLTAFVSPYRLDRRRIRDWVESQGSKGDFIEIFVNTPLEVCIERDPKGFYRQAIEGKIAHFTGISDPYEPPESPELELHTEKSSIQQLANQVIELLVEYKVIPNDSIL